MKEVDKKRFSALLSWANLHGASLHPALEIYKDDLTGFSIRFKSDLSQDAANLKPGDEILICPLKASLSYLNAITGGPLVSTPSEQTDTSSSFPSGFNDLPPHVIGRFFLMKEFLAGKSSFWYPYITTLPQPDVLSTWSLPPFWPEDDAEFLECTNTGISAQAIRDQLKKEFKEARKALKDAGCEDWRDYTRTLHDWAFSIFASRSFRPSLVIPKALRDAALPKGVAIDDFSILLPVFDIINHSPRAQVRWLVDDESSVAHTCRFQSFDTYQPGDQIFNSYGKKTNSELLLSYGFILPETDDIHNDYLHVRKRTGAGGPADSVPGAGSAGPPQDFLVSLRPINHPSSYVGAARQAVVKDRSFQIRPEFSHVEDSLVWDMCLAVVGDGNKESFMTSIVGSDVDLRKEASVTADDSRQRELACLRRILSGSASLPAEACQVVEQVKQLLLAKLGMEYDKLCETNPGVSVDEQGNEIVVVVVPQTHNQSMAMQYRTQVNKVLENAITTLAPDWQSEIVQGQD